LQAGYSSQKAQEYSYDNWAHGQQQTRVNYTHKFVYTNLTTVMQGPIAYFDKKTGDLAAFAYDEV
jgi:hypothetical protein